MKRVNNGEKATVRDKALSSHEKARDVGHQGPNKESNSDVLIKNQLKGY